MKRRSTQIFADLKKKSAKICVYPRPLKLLLAIGWLTLLFLKPPQAAAQSIYFDDSDAAIMRLGNSHYEIGFLKSNGAMAYIIDKATGQPLTEGSRNDCLWGASYQPNGYVGGCHYDTAGANSFGYTWSAATYTLILDYAPDPAAIEQVTAQVVVVATDSHWFDLRLQLQNNSGHLLDDIHFPSDLVFQKAGIEQALLPALPGVIFKPEFFAQDLSYVEKYPGRWFADYMALSSSSGGEIALYALNGEEPIRPLFLGFVHDEADSSQSTSYYYHTFAAKIENGSDWISPWVRIRVSQPFAETIEAYRVDNGLDQLRSLPDKLGLLYAQIARSPIFKADAVQLTIPFSQYAAFLSKVPAPGILHPVAFQPRGFDENHPDFLPPASSLGTTAEMAQMFQAAQAQSFLVMPYSNPTWWDDESPTLQNLMPSLTISDVVVFDVPGTPQYEYYGPAGGYVMSPYAPFVKERLAQLNESMTVDVPSDLLFEDQIGARPWLFDYNAASPAPTAYAQGWLEHTRTYSNTGLMTENGFDRLAETETGFHGSLLLAERLNEIRGWGEADAWQFYPLAPLLVRDKVLFYQHNLAQQTMTDDKETLTWNLAFGYMLTYNLGQAGALRNPWLEVVSQFQKYGLAPYAAEKMTGFVHLQTDVTQTSFENFTVVSNWHEDNAYTTGPYTLPPLGTVVTKNDGSLIFGIFTHYNDTPLSPKDHYLIEQRGSTTIAVRQPMGLDTPLSIVPLPVWQATDPLEVWSYTKNGQVVEKTAVSIGANTITFNYRQEIEGQPVDHYTILKAPVTTSLPIILN